MNSVIFALIGVVFLFGAAAFCLVVYLLAIIEDYLLDDRFTRQVKDGTAYEIFPHDKVGKTIDLDEEEKDWLK